MDTMSANYFYDNCKKNNVTIERLELESGLLTLTKSFNPGDKLAYCDAESDTSIIYSVPCVKSNSSTWGTTGDGIGGYSALLHGVMRINRSSCKKTFLKELKKLMNADTRE